LVTKQGKDFWLQSKEKIFVSAGEHERYQQLEQAYGQFLVRVDVLLKRTDITQTGWEAFDARRQEIRAESQPLFTLCNEVVDAEHKEFNAFVENSDHTLISLQRALLLSLLLLFASAFALAVIVYRGMIAPLRAELTESRAVIERQEKLAALGALGAGVAHEIRNPLQAIKFRLFSLRKSFPSGLAESEDARVIEEEIDRLDRIVRDFLQFARPSEPELVHIPAERILQQVHDLLISQLEKASVRLKLEIVEPVWVDADPRQMEQVLINLVQNSADSIGSNGVITLQLRRATAKIEGVHFPVAVLSVSDTGKGIPIEVQKRLFDPFFTTKDDGTGLGLAIAARIIQKHGGLLRYKTEINRGTTFEILLPQV
jgi:signal transduction histidine kinase